MPTLERVSILAEGLDHPEGVAWGPDGYLYAGGEAGQIYRISLQGKVKQLASTGGFILGLCLDADSNIYACDIKAKAVMRITQAGETSIYSGGTAGRPMITPNFPVFDAHGNLLVADSGGWHRNNGVIYRIAPGGETYVASDLASEFPNGLALSAAGDQLYVALSNVPGIVRLAVHDDASLGSTEMVVETPGVIPDGLALDSEGNLYVGCYTPDIVYKYSPDGRLRTFLEDWESTTISSPTNIAFCGPDLSIMVLANLARWHLAQLESPTPGMPLNYPKIANSSWANSNSKRDI